MTVTTSFTAALKLTYVPTIMLAELESYSDCDGTEIHDNS